MNDPNFKAIEISDASLNVSDLFNQFTFKKWKSFFVDPSGNFYYPADNLEKYPYQFGILINDPNSIDSNHYKIDVSGNIVLSNVPQVFLWKSIYEIYLEKEDLKSRVSELETTVALLMSIIDPSIN